MFQTTHTVIFHFAQVLANNLFNTLGNHFAQATRCLLVSSAFFVDPRVVLRAFLSKDFSSSKKILFEYKIHLYGFLIFFLLQNVHYRFWCCPMESMEFCLHFKFFDNLKICKKSILHTLLRNNSIILFF